MFDAASSIFEAAKRVDSGNDNGARCDEGPDLPRTLVCVRRAAAGRTCGEHQTIYEKASPVHKSNVAACLRHRWIMVLTPSTRRLLDSVAVPVPQ